ncbi:hypothetical protein IOK49_04665 [Fervidicoccus fontis]|jgi:hypothetical protein|uniref:Uncharacterized protein n=2 Tax=Fervidicoccus fontis TaxID=683846 RepID=A0A2J6N2Q1_9CREN|nr:hypothetical protein [Fervidicoccus fontis]MBE9391365.1 hypothetical protein [Fervidicoccus fontis]PMB75614.1 MAG: hypothetical protein C0188_02530 [Fervidicoccus fontis]
MSESIDFVLNRISTKKEVNYNDLKMRFLNMISNVCYQRGSAQSFVNNVELCKKTIKETESISKLISKIISKNLDDSPLEKSGFLSFFATSFKKDEDFYVFVENDDPGIFKECRNEDFCFSILSVKEAKALKDLSFAKELRINYLNPDFK